jgi:ribosomal protein S18 acetylase RimI-like enzyme
MSEHSIIGRSSLGEQEQQDAQALRALVNSHDGLVLKIGLDGGPASPEQAPTKFLVYEGSTLVGYCGVDVHGGGEPEICGMVHPDYRRRGIGRALLARAVEASKQYGAEKLLVIVEENSAAGKPFVQQAGGTYQFGENRMQLVLGKTTNQKRHATSDDSAIHIRAAGPEALDTLVRVTAAVFGDPEEQVRLWMSETVTDPTVRCYIGEQNAETVGVARIYFNDGMVGIYGFGVVPELRGRGYGRQLLQNILDQLQAEGHEQIILEVETENRPAVNLYLSCGFENLTTYGYYQLVA